MLPNINLEKLTNTSSEFDNQNQNFRALLSTNETLPQNFFKEINPRPDGSLVGVGFGMSLGMLEAFENGPQNIVLFDNNQHVVASGRIFIEMLKNSNNFDDFKSSLGNRETISTVYQQVIQNEPGLKDSDINTSKLVDFIYNQFTNFVDIEKGQIYYSVKNKYSQIKSLALENKFNVYLGDMSDKAWTQALGEHISQDSGSHLIYLSNTPDYICSDQGRAKNLNENIDLINSKLPKKPVWVDTLFSSEYILDHHNFPPHFRSKNSDQPFHKNKPSRGEVYYLIEHSLNQNPVVDGDEVVILNSHTNLSFANEFIVPQKLNSGEEWSIRLIKKKDSIICTISCPDGVFSDNPGNRQKLLSFLPRDTASDFTNNDGDIMLKATFKTNKNITITLPNNQKINIQSLTDTQNNHKFSFS